MSEWTRITEPHTLISNEMCDVCLQTKKGLWQRGQKRVCLVCYDTNIRTHLNFGPMIAPTHASIGVVTVDN